MKLHVSLPFKPRGRTIAASLERNPVSQGVRRAANLTDRCAGWKKSKRRKGVYDKFKGWPPPPAVDELLEAITEPFAGSPSRAPAFQKIKACRAE